MDPLPPRLPLDGHPLVLEAHDADHGAYFRASHCLYQARSQYQEIAVFDTELHGRILMLDGFLMVNSRTEAVYHEMLVHLPMLVHPEPKRVLVIGGGDGGVLRQLLKYESITQVVLAELDPAVIEVSRRYFPEFAPVFNDPRVTLQIGDGARYVAESDESFDLCLIDSTDPNPELELVCGPLISPAFYATLAPRLAPSGVGMQLVGSHYFSPAAFDVVVGNLLGVFPTVEVALVPVPFFISGTYALAFFASGRLDPKTPRRTPPPGLSYYNEAVHRAAFAHPNDVALRLSALRRAAERPEG